MTDDTNTSEIDRPALSALSGIRYVGTSDIRHIAVEDLASRGMKIKTDLVWEGYGAVIPIGNLSAAVVDMLAADPDFELVEG